MTTGFRRAERKRVWLKLGITGPTGSGKTYSALKLAFGMGRKVAMLDTENGSGELYAHLGEYDVLTIHAPFTVQKYIEAIDMAAAAGYDVLVIDSLSHAWAADGGLLDQKTALDKRGGNSYTNWAEITKQYERFKSKILQSPIHVVCTMRSKMEYAIEQDERGRTTVRKVGLAPVMRDGIEYEMTTIFDLAMDHGAATSKDRTGLFDGHTKPLSEEDGRRIMQWLESGAEMEATAAPAPEPPAPVAPEPLMDEKTNRRLHALGAEKGYNHDGLKATAAKAYGVEHLKELTEKQAMAMIASLEKKPNVTATAVKE